MYGRMAQNFGGFMKIYMLENYINGKVYIGQTTQCMKIRLNSHFSNSGSPMIHNALNKYGKEGFKITILCKCSSKEELDRMEKYYIKYYNSTNREFGYNISSGGDGTHGYHHTQKAKDAMSKARKGIYLGKDNPFYGKTHSMELKLKRSKCCVIMFPDGHEEIIHGLKPFCIKNNLSMAHMSQVACGNRKQHKGFWCAYI